MIIKRNERHHARPFALALLAATFIGGSFGAAHLGCASNGGQETSERTGVEPASNGASAVQLVDRLSLAFERASAQVSPSVVSIIAEQEVAVRPFGYPGDGFEGFFGDDFFQRFFGIPRQPQERTRTVRSLGSGVIMTKDGYVLTNDHVVRDAEKIRVLIGDGKRYEAEVIGTDRPTDVAVIKIDGSDFPAASAADSDKISIGQWVIAVGNPFQLMHTVTAGIISAKGRSSVGLAEYEDFIQTDASINAGNSGGALADLSGHVIGINTAIASPSGGNVGIGFAIPLNMAQKVMNELISKGKVVRGYLGAWLQDLTDELVEALDLEGRAGALVADIAAGGPADRAGIERGDVIVEYGGTEIIDGGQLKNLVAETAPGTTVDIALIRKGREREVSLKVDERPDREKSPDVPQAKEEGLSSREMGLDVQTATSDLARRLGYEGEKGVLVTRVVPGSPAAEAGLSRGDLIQEVDRETVRTEQEFERSIRSLKAGDVAALLVRRGQNTFFAAVEMHDE